MAPDNGDPSLDAAWWAAYDSFDAAMKAAAIAKADAMIVAIREMYLDYNDMADLLTHPDSEWGFRMPGGLNPTVHLLGALSDLVEFRDAMRERNMKVGG
jgi:hypothetical protein